MSAVEELRRFSDRFQAAAAEALAASAGTEDRDLFYGELGRARALSEVARRLAERANELEQQTIQSRQGS